MYHQGKYEWADTGDIISNDEPTMIYLIFKGINPSTRIGFSNLKYKIDKPTLSKFENNVKYLFDNMISE